LRFLLHTAVTAGLIAALVLTATPIWANPAVSVDPIDASTQTAKPKPLKPQRGELSNSGRASWYSSSMEGNRTASGRPYRANDFTVAHPSLPFGTVLRVHNQTNDRHVLVVVTDRGPHTKGRILDLSQRAAKRLQMTGQGIAPVVMEVVETQDGGMVNPKSGYYLRLEHAQTASDAHGLSSAYKARLNRDIQVLTANNAPYTNFEVCIGPFDSFDAAEEAMRQVDATVKVKDIIEGPVAGSTLPVYAPPPQMALGSDGLPQRTFSFSEK
jgi:rare lipoprotein A